MGMKIEMKQIENNTRRQITFSKRKSSLIRKCNEISVLCDVDVALLTYSPSARLNKFCSKDSIEDVIKSYINLSPTKRYNNTKNLKSKLEKLQMLDFIGDDNNKLDYLNDRIKHLELQEKRSKATLETLEAKFKECDVSSFMEPSMDQPFKCENYLNNSIKLVVDRKTELIRELIHPNGESKSKHEEADKMGYRGKQFEFQFERNCSGGSRFDEKEKEKEIKMNNIYNNNIQKSSTGTGTGTGGQLVIQSDSTTNRLKLSEGSFQDIINGSGSMNNGVVAEEASKFGSNDYDYESVFELGSMGMGMEMGGTASTSTLLTHPQFQISPPPPPPPPPTPIPIQGLFGLHHHASSSYGYGNWIQQQCQYPTPTLGNHENNNQNREDDGGSSSGGTTSTFDQFMNMIGMGIKVNEFDLISCYHQNDYDYDYPSHNPINVAHLPPSTSTSTSQRERINFTSNSTTVANLGIKDNAIEEYYPHNSHDIMATDFTHL